MTGTPIRALLAKPGLDGHDVGVKLVCRALMDAGMEVVYTGLRQSPRTIAEAAVQEDVDVIGLSILSGAHVPLCRKLARELKAAGAGRKLWIVGGNVPPKDVGVLKRLGVHGVFPTGTPFETVVAFIKRRVRR